jgi:hypothetical protein
LLDAAEALFIDSTMGHAYLSALPRGETMILGCATVKYPQATAIRPAELAACRAGLAEVLQQPALAGTQRCSHTRTLMQSALGAATRCGACRLLAMVKPCCAD